MASNRRSSNRIYSRPLSSARTVGRPPVETDGTLRDVWVFVETRRQLTSYSVAKICQNSSFTFVELWSGRPFARRKGAVVRPPSGMSYTRVLAGETLRRAFYDAQNLLGREIAAHKEMVTFFADRGVKVSSLTLECGVERFWRSLVDLEVASLKIDATRISPQLGQLVM